MRSGHATVDGPTGKDPTFDVTQALHDAAGNVIGIVGMDVRPSAARDASAAIARAQAVLKELEAQIPSRNVLISGEAAARPGGPNVALPKFDDDDFVPGVTNPFYPLVPGTTFRFRGTGKAASETGVTTVTRETRMVDGVRVVVVHDQVFENGQLKEDTYDWYAQDRAGNVWYMGEDTREYRNGAVASTEGSWESGKDGARAGIVMWGDPAKHMGELYRQEYRADVAEDMGRIVSLNARVVVPHGSFTGCIETEDTTPLEPGIREHKFYCRGVGVVKEVESSSEGSELIAIEKK
jgi:hypothetical protein